MVIWLSLALVFLVIEILTPVFFSFFFMISAIVVAAASLYVESTTILIILFCFLSVASMYFVRPTLVKYFNVNKTVRKSNIDSFLSKDAYVIEEISSNEPGRIKVGFETWRAETESGVTLKIGEKVKMKEIKGNTVVVDKISKETNDNFS